MFNRLVRWTVFSESDRVVSENVSDAQTHHARQPHGRSHVIGEDKKGTAEWSQSTECHSIAGRRHGVFSNAIVQVSARVASGKKIGLSITHEGRIVRRRQVGRTADQPRQLGGESVQNLS